MGRIDILKEKLGMLPLKGVRASFHFTGAPEEVYIQFKRAFNIKAEIPSYLKDSKVHREIYETGDGEWAGMYIEVFGPHRNNPDYSPIELKERGDEGRWNTIPPLLLWQLIVNKDISNIDFERARVFYKSKGYDFDWYFGKALEYVGRLSKL